MDGGIWTRDAINRWVELFRCKWGRGEGGVRCSKENEMKHAPDNLAGGGVFIPSLWAAVSPLPSLYRCLLFGNPVVREREALRVNPVLRTTPSANPPPVLGGGAPCRAGDNEDDGEDSDDVVVGGCWFDGGCNEGWIGPAGDVLVSVRG